MRRLKLLLHTDFSLAKTGFARNARLLLEYLYKTGKYDLVHFCCNSPVSNPDLQRTPWKSIGCTPDFQHEVDAYLAQFPPEHREPRARMLCYGDLYLDRAIEAEKPDVYMGVQDIWGVDFSIDRHWFDKITSVIWTTLDSLPILPGAVEKAPRIKNYWIWASFATKELHRLGHKHVKTVHGVVDGDQYRILPPEQKLELRRRFNIPSETFVAGYVFRNQLRKSVVNLMEGYKIWKNMHPNHPSFLLLHTNFAERGWDIEARRQELGLRPEDIWTTYICRDCREYEVKQYAGQELGCRFCGAPKGQVTTGVHLGVTEDQLNDVYSLMDIYCHGLTSGGQELPLCEAGANGCIVATTNYSCGEEFSEPGSFGIPLAWHPYREPNGTEFIKATTDHQSIANAMERVFKITPDDRRLWGEKTREWTLKKFSIKSIGPQIEAFLDACPRTTYDFVNRPSLKNPDYVPSNNPNDKEWVKELYKGILGMDVTDQDSGLAHWLSELAKAV